MSAAPGQRDGIVQPKASCRKPGNTRESKVKPTEGIFVS